MSRKPTPAAAPVDAKADHEALAQAGQAATELVLHDEAQQQGLLALSVELGYDGPLSVGALEDGIRFYQRRTVEAILETGKRLLLLKKITPHGDFTKRAELLGISDRTARRFMQAAAKTAKSANLAALSSQVQSASAFLELVTHDDDSDLKQLAELDDVDRMSASQLRAALREAKEGLGAKDKHIASQSAKIDELAEKLERPYKPRKGDPAKNAEDEAALQALADAVNGAEVQFAALAVVVADLQGHRAEAMRLRAQQGVQYLVARLREIVTQNAIDVAVDDEALTGRPEWLGTAQG